MEIFDLKNRETFRNQTGQLHIISYDEFSIKLFPATGKHQQPIKARQINDYYEILVNVDISDIQYQGEYSFTIYKYKDDVMFETDTDMFLSKCIQAEFRRYTK